jgi:hypothetical protein
VAWSLRAPVDSGDLERERCGGLDDLRLSTLMKFDDGCWTTAGKPECCPRNALSMMDEKGALTMEDVYI